MIAKDKLLEMLNKLGRVYKNDATLYLKSLGITEHYASYIVKEMLKEGLLKEEVENKKEYKGAHKIIGISEEGYKYLRKKLGVRKNKDVARKHYGELKSRRFLRLNESRIRLMFEMAGVVTDESEKPTLAEMYFALSEKVHPATGKIYNKQKAQEFLNKGLYYSVQEIRDFLDELSFGVSDTTYKSRIKGMYLSTYTCLMVYITKRGENKLQRTTTQAEMQVVNLLEPLFNLTKVYRILPELSKKKLGAGNKITTDTIATNNVWGLMISDGDSLVYTMTMGRKHGKIKGELSEEAKIGQENTAYRWLKSGSIYKRMFVTPVSLAGVASLEYLCHTPAEQWYEDTKAFVAEDRRFRENDFNPLYPVEEVFAGKRIPTIYIPVFEVNELSAMSEFDYDVTLLTYRDMIDALSHCIRKNSRYYDTDTLELVQENGIMLYDHSGYPKGQKVIQDKLDEMNITCDKRQITALPKKYGMNHVDFFNGVANGEIDVDKIVNSLPVKPKSTKVKRKPRHKGVSLMLPLDMVNMLKEASKAKEISMNRYVMRLIIQNKEQIEKDIKGENDENVQDQE